MKRFLGARSLMILAAIVHLLLVVLCFGGAIMNPERSSLVPIFVFLADVPASYLCDVIRHSLYGLVGDAYSARMLSDAVVFAVIGTLWWILIARVLAWLIDLTFFRKNERA